MRWTWLGVAAMSPACLACSDLGDRHELQRAAASYQARLADPAARARGRVLYQQNCALCHGERGDGRGIRREGLSTSPRDFTDPSWQKGTTPLQVYLTVRDGKAGTSMPCGFMNRRDPK